MFDRRHGETEAAPDADAIKNASSMSVATALNNNVAKISRSCYASDLIEKAQWIDSSMDAADRILILLGMLLLLTLTSSVLHSICVSVLLL